MVDWCGEFLVASFGYNLFRENFHIVDGEGMVLFHSHELLTLHPLVNRQVVDVHGFVCVGHCEFKSCLKSVSNGVVDDFIEAVVHDGN